MALREKVALVLIAVALYKTACGMCSQQSLRKNPFEKYLNKPKYGQSIFRSSYDKEDRVKSQSFYKDFERYSAYKADVNSGLDNFGKTSSIDVLSDSALLNNLRKEKRRKRKNNPIKKPYSRADLPAETLPESFRNQEPSFYFSEMGLFPEVQYPLTATETWAPIYWNPVPSNKEDPYFKKDDLNYKNKHNNKKVETFIQQSAMKENNDFFAAFTKPKEENVVKNLTGIVNIIKPTSALKNISSTENLPTKNYSNKNTPISTGITKHKLKSPEKTLFETGFSSKMKPNFSQNLLSEKTATLFSSNPQSNNKTSENSTAAMYVPETSLILDLSEQLDNNNVLMSKDENNSEDQSKLTKIPIEHSVDYLTSNYSDSKLTMPNSTLSDFSKESTKTSFPAYFPALNALQSEEVPDRSIFDINDSVRKRILETLSTENHSVSSLKENILKIFYEETPTSSGDSAVPENHEFLSNNSSLSEVITESILINNSSIEQFIEPLETNKPLNEESQIYNDTFTEDFEKMILYNAVKDSHHDAFLEKYKPINNNDTEINYNHKVSEKIIMAPIETETTTKDSIKAFPEPIVTEALTDGLRKIIAKPASTNSLIADLREVIRLLNVWNSQIDDSDEIINKTNETATENINLAKLIPKSAIFATPTKKLIDFVQDDPPSDNTIDKEILQPTLHDTITDELPEFQNGSETTSKFTLKTLAADNLDASISQPSLISRSDKAFSKPTLVDAINQGVLEPTSTNALVDEVIPKSLLDNYSTEVIPLQNLSNFAPLGEISTKTFNDNDGGRAYDGEIFLKNPTFQQEDRNTLLENPTIGYGKIIVNSTANTSVTLLGESIFDLSKNKSYNSSGDEELVEDFIAVSSNSTASKNSNRVENATIHVSDIPGFIINDSSTFSNDPTANFSEIIPDVVTFGTYSENQNFDPESTNKNQTIYTNTSIFPSILKNAAIVSLEQEYLTTIGLSNKTDKIAGDIRNNDTESSQVKIFPSDFDKNLDNSKDTFTFKTINASFIDIPHHENIFKSPDSESLANGTSENNMLTLFQQTFNDKIAESVIPETTNYSSNDAVLFSETKFRDSNTIITGSKINVRPADEVPIEKSSSAFNLTFTYHDIISPLTEENESGFPTSLVSTYIPTSTELIALPNDEIVAHDTRTNHLSEKVQHNDEKPFEDACPINEYTSVKDQCFNNEQEDINSTRNLTHEREGKLLLTSFEDPIDISLDNLYNISAPDISLTDLIMGNINLNKTKNESFYNISDSYDTETALETNEPLDFPDYTLSPEDDRISDFFDDDSYRNDEVITLHLENNLASDFFVDTNIPRQNSSENLVDYNSTDTLHKGKKSYDMT